MTKLMTRPGYPAPNAEPQHFFVINIKFYMQPIDIYNKFK